MVDDKARRAAFDEAIGDKINPSVGKAMIEGFYEVFCKGSDWRDSNPHCISVGVYGGVVQTVKNVPAGVYVEIHDFDTEGVEHDMLTATAEGPAVVSTYVHEVKA